MDVRVARVDQLETVLDVLADATNWLLPPLPRGETWLASGYYESSGFWSADERSEATWVVARHEKPLRA